MNGISMKVNADDLIFLNYGFVDFWASRTLMMFDVKHLEEVIRESVNGDTLTVIIAKAPCVLLKGQKFPNVCSVDSDTCKKCGACMKIGCPAMSRTEDGKVKIDATMCNGCGLCKNYCKFGAIQTVER